MNASLRLALAFAAVVGGALHSVGCVGSSDAAIPGGDNSGFIPDDGAGASPGQDGEGETDSESGLGDATAPADVDVLDASTPLECGTCISPEHGDCGGDTKCGDGGPLGASDG
jgi:hypothetical protein